MFETSDDMFVFPFEEEMVNSLFSEETVGGKVLSLTESLLPLVGSPSSPQIPWMCSTRYKTELCSRYADTGTCKYAQRCQFAHGLQELHVPSRHPKYKTELCRTFHTAGYCIYGTRCLFVHSPKEQRPARRRRRNIPCRTFVSFGVCPFGTRCNFLHVEGLGSVSPDSDGPEEERSPLSVPSKPLEHPHPQAQEWKPRGALCRTFTAFGFCLYGTRCRFQHGLPSAVKGSHYSQASASQLSPGSMFSSSCSSPTSALVSPLDPEESSPLSTPAEQPVPHNAFTFSCQQLNDLLLPLALRLQQLEQSEQLYKGADAL